MGNIMSHDHESCLEATCAAAFQFSAPQWILIVLSVWFLAGGAFYVYRLFFASPAQAVNGAWDIENEIGHGLCMFAMVTMITPALLPVPFGVWAAVLGLGALWFQARTVCWGLERPSNKWWWDETHVGMLGFMALMFAGFSSAALTIGAAAFWIYFFSYAAYYSYDLRRGGYQHNWLEVGSDLAHISMGIAMLIMTLWPGLLMAQ